MRGGGVRGADPRGWAPAPMVHGGHAAGLRTGVESEGSGRRGTGRPRVWGGTRNVQGQRHGGAPLETDARAAARAQSRAYPHRTPSVRTARGRVSDLPRSNRQRRVAQGVLLVARARARAGTHAEARAHTDTQTHTYARTQTSTAEAEHKKESQRQTRTNRIPLEARARGGSHTNM